MSALPDELLADVLSELDGYTLFQTAAVSRRIRRLSKTQDAYFFSCPLTIDPLAEPGVIDKRVRRFVTLLQELTQNHERVGLFVKILDSRIAERNYTMVDFPFWEDVVTTVTAAFGNGSDGAKVAVFKYDGNPAFLHRLTSKAFEISAPELFSLRINPFFSTLPGLSLPEFKFSSTLFGGHAPRLKKLDLIKVEIPEGLSALARVAEAELTQAGMCLLRIGNALPSLRSLEVDGGIKDCLRAANLASPDRDSVASLPYLDHCFVNMDYIRVHEARNIAGFVKRIAAEFRYLRISVVLDPSVIAGFLAELILFMSDGCSGSFRIVAATEVAFSYVATFMPPRCHGRTSQLDITFACTEPIKPLHPLQDFHGQIDEITLQPQLVPEFRSLWPKLGRLRRISVELETSYVKVQAWSQFSKMLSHKVGGLEAFIKGSTVSLPGNHGDVVQSADSRTLRLEVSGKSSICTPRSYVIELAIQLGLLPAEKQFNLELHLVSLTGQ